MLGRRKKNPDGFEWHKYIRTTIKLRREQRRQRMEEARRAAGQQMHAAGAALAAGSRAAGAAAWDGARAGIGAAGLAAQGAASLAGAGAKFAGRKAGAGFMLAAQRLAIAARPLIELLARPNIGGPVALAGGLALGLGIGRYRGAGLDGEAATMLALGAVLLAAALPMLSRLTGVRMPQVPAKAALIAAAAVAAAGGVAWLSNRGGVDLAGLTGNVPLIGSKPLQGRAQALGGDLVRVANTTVRLAGIEAPERHQRCGKSAGRQWRCGAAAEAALSRLVSGRTLSCALSGSDSAGRPLANCTRGKTDINAELVRQGAVFAEGGLFSRYASAEKEARAAKAGIWSAGEAERPSEYRAKVWEEAKRRAPEGCPIKGLVSGGARVYVLPWSPDYERGRIQKARGDRWFCSEQEAVSAGWKAATRG